MKKIDNSLSLPAASLRSARESDRWMWLMLVQFAVVSHSPKTPRNRIHARLAAPEKKTKFFLNFYSQGCVASWRPARQARHRVTSLKVGMHHVTEPKTWHATILRQKLGSQPRTKPGRDREVDITIFTNPQSILPTSGFPLSNANPFKMLSQISRVAVSTFSRTSQAHCCTHCVYSPRALSARSSFFAD